MDCNCIGAAGGLSALLRRCRKAGPAALRGLLTSPPQLAGQASAPLRGSCVNPCRASWPLPSWGRLLRLHFLWFLFAWTEIKLPNSYALIGFFRLSARNTTKIQFIPVCLDTLFVAVGAGLASAL